MKIIILILLMISSLFCEAVKIKMLDFATDTSTRCNKNWQDLKEDADYANTKVKDEKGVFFILNNFAKVTDLPSAILNVKDDRGSPDQMTVCSTIYIDMDDCDGVSFGGRIFPIWSGINQGGKTGMSFFFSEGYEKTLFLQMGTIDQIYDGVTYIVGKIQFWKKKDQIIFPFAKLSPSPNYS